MRWPSVARRDSHQILTAAAPRSKWEDFDAAIAHLKRHDVEFRIEPLSTPVCRMAIIFDLDGNSICIHKRNPGR
jgi:hypothetical protein